MKAYALTGYGKTGNVTAVERARPVVGDDDVLIEIHAASINPLDSKIRKGELKQILPYKLPIVLGNDLAGVVVETGRRVTRFTVGDSVFTKPRQDRIGAFAQYLAVNEADVAHKPKTVDMIGAAALPLVALTAWQALVDKAGLRPGHKVLIHAGSGGLGSVAIQLAKHLGAEVATTTSGKNAGWVKELGADIVIDYTTQDFAAELSGYDVVLDTQGGETLEKSLSVLKPGGTVISVAGPPEPLFAKEFGLNWLLIQAIRGLSFSIRRKARQKSVRYVFLFMTANGEQLGRLAELVDAGAMRPIIDRTFPFAETLDALAYVEGGRSKGKVVVTVDDGRPST
jgi:NADPH:quinone reductase-like Zn-dependent oxidoreductase